MPAVIREFQDPSATIYRIFNINEAAVNKAAEKITDTVAYIVPPAGDSAAVTADLAALYTQNRN